jgi:phosphotransferase system HPr (HPr) family protein
MITVLSKEFLLVNQGGLHARPATFLVQLANKFKSDIQIRYKDKQVNGKSVVALMTLGVVKGETIIVLAEGEDENLAMKEITEYLEQLND